MKVGKQYLITETYSLFTFLGFGRDVFGRVDHKTAIIRWEGASEPTTRPVSLLKSLTLVEQEGLFNDA